MFIHLPHRVSVMEESRTEYQGGCWTTSWISTSIEWANCQVVSDSEYHEEKKQQYSKWIVVMRKGTNVNNTNRLIYDSKILTIEAGNDPTSRGRMIEVTCREEVL